MPILKIYCWHKGCTVLNCLKMNQEDLSKETAVGINIASFLGTVTLFFAGILISRLQSFDKSLKMPILYLVVATLGFIFSAVIYANMTGAKRLNTKSSESYIQLGNSLSEYLGLYPFLAAIPMVVSAVTPDSFLKIAILSVTIISLTLYSMSPFSLPRRVFGNIALVVFTIFVVFSAVMAFVFQYKSTVIFNTNGAVFLFALAIIAFMHRRAL